MSDYGFSLFHIVRGIVMEAEYGDPLLEDYRGNPLIEALPPIWDESNVVTQLRSRPLYNISERDLPTQLRFHCVQRIARDFFQPLSQHLDMEQRISRLLRDGYVGRNPSTPNYAFRARSDAYELITTGNTSGFPVMNPTSSGFAFVGISGVGKSSAMVRVLSMYPQVVIHSRYQEKNLNLYQIVWLKMDCPHDGSIRGLCLNFFLAIDTLIGTNYYKKHAGGRKTIDELLPIMAQVASVHCIGVLVIDEIQNLIEAKAGLAPKMLNFFVQMVNTIGLPVVIIGTFKALPILNGEFRNARRSSGQGDLIWDRLGNDEEWEMLLMELFKYQWTVGRVEYSEQMKQVLYDESQGITDVAIKLFMLAQWRAIDHDMKHITPSLIHSSARDQLQLLQPALNALRSGDKAKIAKFGDVFSSYSLENYFNEVEAKHKQQERIETIKNELGFNVQDQTKSAVSKWLQAAGIDEQRATEAAQFTITEYFNSLHKIDINQMALKKALSMITEKKIDKAQSLNKRKKAFTIGEVVDLRTVVALGKSKKMPAYEALKAAGYIKNPIELLS